MNGKGAYIREDTKPDTVSKWEAAIDTSIFVVMGGFPSDDASKCDTDMETL